MTCARCQTTDCVEGYTINGSYMPLCTDCVGEFAAIYGDDAIEYEDEDDPPHDVACVLTVEEQFIDDYIDANDGRHGDNCGCYGREHEGERSHYIPHDIACVLTVEEQFIDDYCDTSIDDLMEF